MSHEFSLMKLAKGDKIVTVLHSRGNDELLLATANGAVIRFNENDIRATGSSSGGVRGMDVRQRPRRCGLRHSGEGYSLVVRHPAWLCQYLASRKFPLAKARRNRQAISRTESIGKPLDGALQPADWLTHFCS